MTDESMELLSAFLDGEDIDNARSGSELFIENCLPAAP